MGGFVTNFCAELLQRWINEIHDFDKEKILEDEETLIRLSDQATLRVKLVNLFKKCDARKELLERIERKFTEMYDRENLDKDKRPLVQPDYVIADIKQEMRCTLERLKEGCPHLMYERISNTLFDHIYAEGGC
jgi:hypothetical protein